MISSCWRGQNAAAETIDMFNEGNTMTMKHYDSKNHLGLISLAQRINNLKIRTEMIDDAIRDLSDMRKDQARQMEELADLAELLLKKVIEET